MSEIGYQGRLEFITTGKIYGWLVNKTQPELECLVDLYVNGWFMGTYPCNEYHEALASLPGHKGFGVFNIPLPPDLLGVEDCVVDIRIHGTAASIPNAPIVTSLHRAIIDTALSGMTPERKTLCRTALAETLNLTKRARNRVEDPRLTRPAPGYEEAELTIGAFLAHQLHRLGAARDFHLRSAADLLRFLVRHADRFNLADHAWCPLPADVTAFLASGEEDAGGMFRSRLLAEYKEQVLGTASQPTGTAELSNLVHWMFGKARLPKTALAAEHADYLNGPAALTVEGGGTAGHGLLSRFYVEMHAMDDALGSKLAVRDDKALFVILLSISLWLVRWNLDDLFLPPAVRALFDRRIQHAGREWSGLGYFFSFLDMPGAEGLTLDALRRRQEAAAVTHDTRRPAQGGGNGNVQGGAPTGGVNLFGYFDGSTGISRNALFSREILAGAGVPVTMPPVVLPQHHATEALYPVNLIHFGIIGAPGDMVNHGMERFAGAYNIGFFLWETSLPPRSSLLTLELMDEIWTLSDFCAQGLARHFHGPIHVVPNCVDERATAPAPEGADGAGRRGDRPFTFYFCFDARSWYTRKNPLAAARAFRLAFPPDDPSCGDVRLLLRIRYRASSRSVADTAHRLQLDRLARLDPRIVIRDQDLPYADSLAEMRNCDCYVSLHRAEGFGYTMAEAMMMGKPVIASRYSANLDYMTDRTGFLVDGRERFIEPDEYIDVTPGAAWFEPDVAAAAAAMRRVRFDDPEARRRAEAGRELVRRTLNRKSVQDLYVTRLNAALEAARGRRSEVR
ncbi:glycosyltransferase [Azorhizobium sp. AG788]|uniref:glycosyltransferase n=1 Tax=Azorhizobium sp. AG788 TaxID=2183897 RepID=UPI00313A11CA